MKYKVGLDFDGVVADSASLKRVLLQEMYGIVLPEGTIISRDAVVNQLRLVSGEDYTEMTNRLYEDPKLITIIPPIAGAFESMFKLNCMNVATPIITNREPIGGLVANAWLIRNNSQRSREPIKAIGQDGNKADHVVGCFAFVDDTMRNLYAIHAVHPEIRLFYFLNPHNLDQRDDNIATSIWSWSELLPQLVSLLKVRRELCHK